MNQTERQFKQLFQQQKVTDDLNTPSFSTIFNQAEQQRRTKNRTKFLLMVASIAVLAIIGFAINEDKLPLDMDNIAIAKGSTNFYETLMADGKIISRDIHFEYDKAVLKPNSFSILQKMTKMLQENEHIQLVIEGHTDNRGAAKYNQQLSTNRAETVRLALIKMGIKGNRLTANGLGETQPVNANRTEAEQALNRRVEFVLVK